MRKLLIACAAVCVLAGIGAASASASAQVPPYAAAACKSEHMPQLCAHGQWMTVHGRREFVVGIIGGRRPIARAATSYPYQMLHAEFTLAWGPGGLCISSLGNRSWGSALWLYSCNGDYNQSWYIDGCSSLGWCVQNEGTGLCMNDPGGNASNGTQIIQWGCTSSPWNNPDIWSIVNEGGGNIEITPASNRYASCVEDRGWSPVNYSVPDIWTCNGGGNQLWNPYG